MSKSKITKEIEQNGQNDNKINTSGDGCLCAAEHFKFQTSISAENIQIFP